MADFCRFSILTEIVLNHMTETAEILPKGLTVERNDFDRWNISFFYFYLVFR